MHLFIIMDFYIYMLNDNQLFFYLLLFILITGIGQRITWSSRELRVKNDVNEAPKIGILKNGLITL